MFPLYQSFNSMVKELKIIEILRTDFISHFSHEFKTPIVSIKGFANLAKSENISKEERDEYLNIIINEIDRLVTLSNQTLLLTRLESIEIVVDKELYNLDEQIRQSILLLQNQWEEKNINLKIDLEKVKISSNKDLLQQLWINILNNSIKYSYDGGNIHVVLKEKDENSIQVIIKDNGIGIDDETLKHIFTKFYQVDSSRKTEGLGLGLSIVKIIIDLCEGSIDVKSEKGKGTTFFITLPK